MFNPTVFYPILPEDEIRANYQSVDWEVLVRNQLLSEDLLRTFVDRVDLDQVCYYQKISESFIRDFVEPVESVKWRIISARQKLSESFITEFSELLDWDNISRYQPLSANFANAHADLLDIEQHRKSHLDERFLAGKVIELEEYAEKYGLRYIEKTDEYIAYRTHRPTGKGIYSNIYVYEPGNVYRDWHCDLDATSILSFGLTILPRGNTPVAIRAANWGHELIGDVYGRARVWQFRVITSSEIIDYGLD